MTSGIVPSFDVVVIGGSQTGLAIGYHLARRGLRFVILDAGPEIGHVWRSRWDSLTLFTPAQYSGQGRDRPGTPMATSARFRMHGSLKLGRPWEPFRARQVLSLPTTDSCGPLARAE